MSLDEMVLYIGPQHPTTHGFAFRTTVVGDWIVKVEPMIGYFHRSFEKVLENRTYVQGASLIDRMSMLEAILVEWAYCMAAEEIAGVEVPPRAQYLRTMFAELSRIHNFLFWFGQYGMELGVLTLLFWPWRDREYILDIQEHLTGSRHTVGYLVPGGVRPGFREKIATMIEGTLDYLEARVPMYRKMFLESPTFQLRTKGVGVLTKEMALKLGVTGPNLKATGAPIDLRKLNPYGVYDELDFEVPTEEDGDNWARASVRLKEIETSISLVRQLLPKIPQGPNAVKFPHRLPEGEGYGRVEGARGFFCVYMKTREERGNKPWRVKVRGPSLQHMYSIQHLAPGNHFADFPAIYHSLDAYGGDMDR